MQPKCTCKKEIEGWYFNFDTDSSKFERCDIVGEKIIKLLRKLKAINKTSDSIANVLYRVEKDQKLRAWILKEVKKQLHKDCYGWQCKMKIVKVNKLCLIHGTAVVKKG